MKYIITESKIKNYIFEYLDNYNFHITINENNDDIYIWDSENSFISRYFVYIRYEKKYNQIFINHRLVLEIHDIFNLNNYYIMEIINDWFMKKFNLNDVGFYSDFATDYTNFTSSP